MQDRIYIARFGEGIEAYEALLCPELKEKSNRIKHQIKRRAGMAAALLFQYAVARQYEAEQCEIAQFKTEANAPEFEEVDFANVIEYLKIHDLKLPKIHYGPKGKPYVKENRWNGKPFYYNLSHSGNLVACAISDAEVGIDVQECKDIGFLQMAGKDLTAKRKKVIINPLVKNEVHAGIAQLVEQLIRNQQVAGSSPVTSSRKAASLSGCSFFVQVKNGGNRI